MSRVIPSTLLLAAVLGGCTQPSPDQVIVLDAITAMGGNRVTRVKTFVIEGAGRQANLGQDLTPGATGQAFEVSGYRRAVDWSKGAPRLRAELTRTPNFSYFLGQDPQKVVNGLDGDVGYNVSADGNANRISEAATTDRRAETYHHPLTAIRAAIDPGARLSNGRVDGSERLVDVTTASGSTFTFAIDTATKRPTRVTSRGAHPNLGDVTIETRFTDYQDVDGLHLPGRLTTRTDDVTTSEIVVAKQGVDVETGDLAAPAAVAAKPPATPPAPTVSADEVVPGVWLLGGQSHHSALVEFADHLMLIEAPQSEARTLAVIAVARELRPGKPLTQLVNSHHHFDHSAGVRAAVSEGLTVITHAGNAAFIREIATRPHTLTPDALARKPGTLSLETVDEPRTFEDAAMTLVLYPIDGNPHSETLLMAYLPKQRILIQADAFSPGFDIQPYAPNLIENLRTRKLRVDRVVPLHGPVGPYSELEKWAAPATPAR